MRRRALHAEVQGVFRSRSKVHVLVGRCVFRSHKVFANTFLKRYTVDMGVGRSRLPQMSMRVYALPLLTIFILMGTFGVFALMGPMHAEMGCPFMLGQTALCTTNTLEHLKHWQVAFAGIFAVT